MNSVLLPIVKEEKVKTQKYLCTYKKIKLKFRKLSHLNEEDRKKFFKNILINVALFSFSHVYRHILLYPSVDLLSTVKQVKYINPLVT